MVRKSMQLNDAAAKYISTLADDLLQYNFRRKGKNHIFRKVNDCTQEVCVMITRLRGTDSIDVRYNVSYSYPVINKIASYIQGIPFRKKLATGVFHSIIDLSCKIQYSHVISEKTIEQDIMDFAHLDSQSIIAYFLPLLEKCDTPEKLLVALNEDSNVAESIVGLGLKEWLQISALLYLGKADTALQLYDNWTPIAWFGRQVLSDAQKNMCRWRIATLGADKIPDDYPLFGRQGNGKVLPVPEQFENLK